MIKSICVAVYSNKTHLLLLFIHINNHSLWHCDYQWPPTLLHSHIPPQQQCARIAQSRSARYNLHVASSTSSRYATFQQHTTTTSGALGGRVGGWGGGKYMSDV